MWINLGKRLRFIPAWAGSCILFTYVTAVDFGEASVSLTCLICMEFSLAFPDVHLELSINSW